MGAVVATIRHEEEGEDASRSLLPNPRDELRDLLERFLESSEPDGLDPTVDLGVDVFQVGQRGDRLTFDQGAELTSSGEPDYADRVLLLEEFRQPTLELLSDTGKFPVHTSGAVNDHEVVRRNLYRLWGWAGFGDLVLNEVKVVADFERSGHGGTPFWKFPLHRFRGLLGQQIDPSSSPVTKGAFLQQTLVQKLSENPAGPSLRNLKTL